MWKPKWLVFSGIVLILLIQQETKAQDESAREERPNSQVVLNFFLYGVTESPPKRYWRRLINNQEDCNCENCNCENCNCEGCNCEDCNCPNCNCKKDGTKLYNSVETFDYLNKNVERAKPYRQENSEDCVCEDCNCDDCNCKNCDCKNKDKNPEKVTSKRNLRASTKFESDVNLKGLESYKKFEGFSNWWNKMKMEFITFIHNIYDDIPVIHRCKSCAATVNLFLEYKKITQINSDNTTLREILEERCSTIQSKVFCKGFLDLNYDIITYIVDSRPDLTAEKICNITGQALGCFVRRDSDQFNSWEIDIPPPLSNLEPNTININLDPLKILQISDINYDPKYKKGNKVKCAEPLCCRTELDMFEIFDERAGQWGNYQKCDMPMDAIKNLMQQTSQHDVEFVYFTGDVNAHNIWESSKETNSKSLVDIYHLFYETFVLRNITVYPILGTHDFYPMNSVPPKDAPEKFSQQWLFDLIAEIWGAWLPEETLETIKRGGFYTVVPKPGFRIIALNSNVAFVYNWWLLYNDTDPYGQLQWLADTLSLAEQNNEYVHILSHLPSGDKETYAKWAYEYSRIIHRFAHIITGQFCGHSLNVQMYYFQDPDNIEYPVNIMYNGGSFTAYGNKNPNYRVYYVHPETMAVENFNDWYFDLTMANENGVPQWTYSDFKQIFGLESMSYEEMGQLVQKMVENKSYLEIYSRLKVQFGDTSLQEGRNYQRMLKKTLCDIFKTEADSDKLCDYFVNIFEKNHEIRD